MTLHISVVSRLTQIRGEISLTEDIRIDGKLVGTIIGSNVTVIIGKTGEVSGDIKCQKLIVQGKLKGESIETEILEISATGIVNGNVSVENLEIEQGGQLLGSCEMSSSTTKKVVQRN